MIGERSTHLTPLSPGLRILAVDGGAPQAVTALRAGGFAVESVSTSEDAAAGNLDDCDLVLLDLLLPGLSGIEACRRIRRRSTVPVVVVTGLHAEIDRVLSLEAGADDCISRPVSGKEVVARVRAILRRRELNRQLQRHSTHRVGSFQLDLSAQVACLDGRRVDLTPTEFRLLALLAGHPERVHTRSEIVARLWRSSHTGDERACDTHIKNLRRKIERDPARPRYLVTVRGVGYMLRPD
jgi:two-component system response regulator RegX3